MRTSRLASCLTALLLLAGCDSTGPSMTIPGGFEVVFGTENSDGGHALLQAANGDLLIAGVANGILAPADGTLPTPALSRLTPEGTVEWTRTFDTLQYGEALAVLEHPSGGFLLLTTRHDASFDNRSMALWQTDSDATSLEMLYQRPHGRSSFSSRPLIQTRDGGYVLVGTQWPRQGTKSVFVTKLNAQGAVQWTRELPRRADLNAVLETSNGDVVVLGSERVEGPTYDEDLLLARLDANGNVRWTRNLGQPERTERGFALVSTGDGFLLAGLRDDAGTDWTPRRPFIMKLDPDGNTLWEQIYTLDPDLRHASIGNLIATLDGSFALTGSLHTRTEQYNPDSDRYAAFVLKINAEGKQRWLQRFGRKGLITVGHDMLQRTDGRLIVVGAKGPDIPSYGGSDFDTFVLMLDQEGNTP